MDSPKHNGSEYLSWKVTSWFAATAIGENSILWSIRARYLSRNRYICTKMSSRYLSFFQLDLKYEPLRLSALLFEYILCFGTRTLENVRVRTNAHIHTYIYMFSFSRNILSSRRCKTNDKHVLIWRRRRARSTLLFVESKVKSWCLSERKELRKEPEAK